MIYTYWPTLTLHDALPILKANNLSETVTPPLTTGGQAPDHADFQLPPALQPVVKAAFTLAPDDDPVVEDLGQHNYAIVAVGEVVEAAPRPLNQIREQVAADLVRSRAFDKAKEQAEMVVAKVKAGLPLRHVLADAKLPAPQTVTNRRIDVASQRSEEHTSELQSLIRIPYAV